MTVFFIALTGMLAAGPEQSSGSAEMDAVASITALRNQPIILSGTSSAVVVLGYWAAGDGGGGNFYYDPDSHAPDDGGMVIAPAVGTGRWLRVVAGHISPEMFGARGDGATDDYEAFRNLAAYVNEGGCSRISLASRKTYFWGRYIEGSHSSVTDIEFRDVNGLSLDGAGSTILVRGGFNRSTRDVRPLNGLVLIRCHQAMIRNLLLDGNSPAITKSKGVSEPNSDGVSLNSCSNIVLQNVIARKWTCDGFYISCASSPLNPLIASRQITMLDCVADENARQGMSIIQLRGGVFTNCVFSNTGQSAYGHHAPSAGVDIEPDYSVNGKAPYKMDVNTGELTFTRCRFIHNLGMALVGGGNTVDNVTCAGSYIDAVGAEKYAFQIAGVNFMVRDSYFNCGQAAIYDLLTPPDSGGSLLFEHNEVHGTGTLFYSAGKSYPVTIRDCRFFMEETAPSQLYALYLTNPDVLYQNNYLFIDGKGYIPSPEGYQVKSLINGQSHDNRYETNLAVSAVSGNKAHYALGIYSPAAVLWNEWFKGTNPGPNDTFQPMLNGDWDTRLPFTNEGVSHPRAAGSVEPAAHSQTDKSF